MMKSILMLLFESSLKSYEGLKEKRQYSEISKPAQSQNLGKVFLKNLFGFKCSQPCSSEFED